MLSKRGQASIEYLATYGWAILVVLVTIGALAHFGILNPARYIPESCGLDVRYGCSNFLVNSYVGNVIIQVESRSDDDILITGFAVQGNDIDCDIDDTMYPMATDNPPYGKGLLLERKKTVDFSLPCSSLRKTNNKIRADITMTFKTIPFTVEKQIRGDLIASPVESVWPTQELCQDAQGLNVCAEMQVLYPPQDGFLGFACECSTNFGLCAVGC